MKSQRLPKGVTESYSSFEELAKAFGLKPIRKQTKDKEKLAAQRQTFCGKHLCSACKQPMTWMKDSNQMVCQNPQCKGIPHEQVINSETGETKVWYSPSYDLLDERGAEIAENIFTEYDD